MYMLRRFRGRLCQNLRGYRSAQPPPAAAAAALRKCTGGMERERERQSKGVAAAAQDLLV